MSIKTTFTTAILGTLMMGGAALADGIMIKDPYARSSRQDAPTGAAFMMIMNHSKEDIHLIAAHSDVAKKVELHTHMEDAEGVMKMMQIEGGIMIPAGGSHMLKRGGDHVMFMGLNESLVQGETISVTLEFEKAGKKTIDIIVDHERSAGHDMDHSEHKEHADH